MKDYMVIREDGSVENLRASSIEDAVYLSNPDAGAISTIIENEWSDDA